MLEFCTNYSIVISVGVAALDLKSNKTEHFQYRGSTFVDIKGAKIRSRAFPHSETPQSQKSCRLSLAFRFETIIQSA